jgi:3-hydroxymyristoyl/3-hydroxydecanoyl-(acyl carrier protein) dehydratase
MSNKIYSIGKILELLPYQYPMLLIDRFWQESETKFVALKNVTITEEYFNGHFPSHPIMPGVLQIEATFQAAVLAVKEQLDPADTLDIYMKSMKNAKFRKPTEPGDRLVIDVEVIQIEKGEAVIKATNKNNAGLSTQVEMILATRPRIYNVEKPELFTKYDKNPEVSMDLEEIKKYMPHRYPFLFIDYVAYNDGETITAIKNVTYNDPIMHSYSSGYSVLPGSIQSEIIAQAGCAYTLAHPANKGKLAFFMTIPYAEFYHPIHPGDQLRIELHVPTSQSKFGKGTGDIFVENKLVSKGAITFAVVDA